MVGQRVSRALCRVEHPNITRFYSLATDEARGIIGLAMEHVAGTPLDRTSRRFVIAPSSRIENANSASGSPRRSGGIWKARLARKCDKLRPTAKPQSTNSNSRVNDLAFMGCR